MIDYGERIKVLSDRKPIARKVHRCGECHRDIQPGEQYERTVGLWEGELETHKTCLHCVAVREWLSQVCNGWVYGAVGEDLCEHFREGYGIWLARAYIGVRDKWRRRDGSLRAPMTLPDQLPTGA
ncbi:MAG: hypothetical protein WD079_01730 [Phycisphaeraceae bacterium]